VARGGVLNVHSLPSRIAFINPYPHTFLRSVDIAAGVTRIGGPPHEEPHSEAELRALPPVARSGRGNFGVQVRIARGEGRVEVREQRRFGGRQALVLSAHAQQAHHLCEESHATAEGEKGLQRPHGL
jgi:hypothetical protein